MNQELQELQRNKLLLKQAQQKNKRLLNQLVQKLDNEWFRLQTRAFHMVLINLIICVVSSIGSGLSLYFQNKPLAGVLFVSAIVGGFEVNWWRKFYNSFKK